jgi:large subunit ribosomal protein L5
MNRLKQRYEEEIIPAMRKRFGYKNRWQVPHLEKVVINMGVGEAARDAKAMDGAVRSLTQISGQKPIITRAKKSIANFKIRAGMMVGCRVTLRGERMFAFLDKLLNVSLPRIRDFRGTSPRSFDGRGNYSIGIREQLIFPEINYDDVDKIRGMDITIVTTANTDEEGRAFLELLGMPFGR